MQYVRSRQQFIQGTDYWQRNCSLPSVSGMTCRPTTVQELASCLCPDMVVRRKMAACAQNNCIYKDVLRKCLNTCLQGFTYLLSSRGSTSKIVLCKLSGSFARRWAQEGSYRVVGCDHPFYHTSNMVSWFYHEGDVVGWLYSCNCICKSFNQ